MTELRVVAISGGTGSAKLVRGLAAVGPFSAVANVGDDDRFHGLYVCPDVDTLTYALAGVLDAQRGWGVRGDTFAALEQLKRLGAPGTWFNIGDADMAVHLLRTAMLAEGRSLTEVTAVIASRLGVTGCDILPATDSRVATRVRTREKGELSLQEFWVREGGRPTPEGVRYEGAEAARPTEQVLERLRAAERLVIAPANPITSIMPTLSLDGFRDALRASPARKVAVSPMVGRAAYSGPAARLMEAAGLEPTSEGVARLYGDVIDAIVIDESDRAQAEAIEGLGVSCTVAPTLMRSAEDERRLARVALEA